LLKNKKHQGILDVSNLFWQNSGRDPEQTGTAYKNYTRQREGGAFLPI